MVGVGIGITLEALTDILTFPTAKPSPAPGPTGPGLRDLKSLSARGALQTHATPHLHSAALRGARLHVDVLRDPELLGTDRAHARTQRTHLPVVLSGFYLFHRSNCIKSLRTQNPLSAYLVDSVGIEPTSPILQGSVACLGTCEPIPPPGSPRAASYATTPGALSRARPRGLASGCSGASGGNRTLGSTALQAVPLTTRAPMRGRGGRLSAAMRSVARAPRTRAREPSCEGEARAATDASSTGVRPGPTSRAGRGARTCTRTYGFGDRRASVDTTPPWKPRPESNRRVPV